MNVSYETTCDELNKEFLYGDWRAQDNGILPSSIVSAKVKLGVMCLFLVHTFEINDIDATDEPHKNKPARTLSVPGNAVAGELYL